jgi:hypothetical protein
MSQRFHERPSKLLGDLDEYTAFCLDEACAYILARLDNEEEMFFKKKYRSFGDLYSQYDN